MIEIIHGVNQWILSYLVTLVIGRSKMDGNGSVHRCTCLVYVKNTISVMGV